MLIDRTFLNFLLIRVCGTLASTILSVTIGWHLYQATRDPFDLALVGLMQLLPMLLLLPVTGWVVDHYPRKRVLLTCSALRLAVFATLAMMLADGEVDKFLVFCVIFAHGATLAFSNPAMQAALPNIVGEHKLARAVAVASTTWTFAATAGPFLAGLLISALNYHTYWLLVALSGLAVLLLLGLPKLEVEQAPRRGGGRLWQGVRFVRGDAIVLPSIALDLLIVLAGSVMVLLPVVAVEILEVGPEALGAMRAMPALGALVVGAMMARMPELRQTGRLLFFSLLVFAASITLFAFSEILWLSLFALLVYGGSDMVSVNIRLTLIQLATPDELRGRVSAVNSLFIATSNDLGDFRAGSVAAAIGTGPALLVGAAMAFLVVLLGYALSPKLRRLDRLSDASANRARHAPPRRDARSEARRNLAHPTHREK